MKAVTCILSMGFFVMSVSCGHPSEKQRSDNRTTSSNKNEKADQESDPTGMDGFYASVPANGRISMTQALSPTVSSNGAVSPTTAPLTTGWAQIPNPTNPSQVIPSYSSSGTLNAIAAGNTGSRSSTWSFTKVPAGKYVVEIFYLTEAANATCVAVQFKTTGQTGFSSITVRLDQKTGNVKVGTKLYTNRTTSLGTASGSFASVSTDLTPTAINVRNGSGANSGTLDVRISDSGCASGRMIADMVRIRSI